MQNFGEGIQFELNYVELGMKSPEVVYENRNVELLAFPLNHRVETFGFIIREKMPSHNVYKDAISKYGLNLTEIGTLKRGEDVVRENGELIKASDAAYIPYNPRSYAYCSDTAPFPELSQWVKGVTLLYHEATFPQEMTEMAEKTFHSTTLQAAQAALDAGVGKLLVGHYSSRFPSVDFYLDEIRSVFPAAMLAHDMDVIELDIEKTS
jgi:ribonuclease Z